MSYLVALGKPQATISEEAAQEMEADQEPNTRRVSLRKDSKTISLSAAEGDNTSKLPICALHDSSKWPSFINSHL